MDHLGTKGVPGIKIRTGSRDGVQVVVNIIKLIQKEADKSNGLCHACKCKTHVAIVVPIGGERGWWRVKNQKFTCQVKMQHDHDLGLPVCDITVCYWASTCPAWSIVTTWPRVGADGYHCIHRSESAHRHEANA